MPTTASPTATFPVKRGVPPSSEGGTPCNHMHPFNSRVRWACYAPTLVKFEAQSPIAPYLVVALPTHVGTLAESQPLAFFTSE